MSAPSSSPLDVLVVGSGPVGLSLAADLAWHGLRCRIIDKAEKASPYSRAVVIMPRMLAEFDLRGIADDVIAAGHRMNSFGLFADGHLIGRTRYGHFDSKFPFLLCAPQTETEKILTKRMNRLGVKTEWSTEMLSFRDDGAGVTAQIRRADGSTEEVRAAYLAGCDGAHSVIRHALDIPFEGEAYKDVWMLGDVKVDWNYPRDEACSFLHDDGYMAVFPMPGGRSRIFCVCEDETKVPEEVTLSELEMRVNRWSFVKARLSEPHWLTKFHVHHRKAKRYGRGRAFIAGDAAHLHSPETGLGMNTGIQDVYNLAWKLALVVKGRSPATLLDTYDVERGQVGREVVQFSNVLHKLSAQFTPLMEKVRNRTFEIMNQFYELHFESVATTAQLNIRYAKSPIIEDHRHMRHLVSVETLPAAGARARDVRILRARDLKWSSLLVEIPANKHHLLLFTGMRECAEAVEKIEAAIAAVAPWRDVVDVLLISAREDLTPLAGFDAEMFLDVSLECHEKYGGRDGCAYLIRPDGYIGFRSFDILVPELESYLQRLFVP